MTRHTHHISPLQARRLTYQPTVPKVLEDLNQLTFQNGEKTTAVKDAAEINARFPHTFGQSVVHAKIGGCRPKKVLRVGVVLSGGQAAGGHNVIAGLFDALKAYHRESQLHGFLGGPSGIIKGEAKQLAEDEIARYRNLGGFDLIGSGRTKIETPEQFKQALSETIKRRLDGIVVIGGDDSNTNAALLAEYFLAHDCAAKVIGVPKTIDGDLKNEFVEVSFGFDTACRTYAEMIGNIARDALSAKKYVHFIKLMGRSASHIALECALQTQANLTWISEEVLANKETLAHIVADIVAFIRGRSKPYGVILIPEGLIEFIPEMKQLIAELNDLLPKLGAEREKVTAVAQALTQSSRDVFSLLPEEIGRQLLLDRDPHGNVQVSHIQTEKLLSSLVNEQLSDVPFQPVHHFFGYEGRSALPSNFDATYCYALGRLAAALIHEGYTGYMSCIRHLTQSPAEWGVCGLPITSLMNMEQRSGKKKPVIQKALVDLRGASFKMFAKHRARWKKENHYRYPGPIQFEGDPTVTDQIPLSLVCR
ncbi:MAG: diphosphate--fructose-6-phosphate 1-phosphotransferase [Chlamydiota bacterium]